MSGALSSAFASLSLARHDLFVVFVIRPKKEQRTARKRKNAPVV
jgi:hypothetical protein